MTLDGRDGVGVGDTFETRWFDGVRECRLDWDIK